jgi:hypothetical protein
MKLNTNYKILSFAIGFLTIVACTKEDNTANLIIKASANYSTLKAGSNLAQVELSKFMVNIEKIELEYDDDQFENESENESENSDQHEDLYEDTEFYGPFELNLLGGTSEIRITDAAVPYDTFEEIEFDMAKGRVEGSELFGKSILAEGSIDGVPFIFWHDTDDEFEVDYPDTNQDLIITGNAEGIVINFNLDRVFGVTSSIDLSSAIDGNNDGLIEIYPGDPDGNSQLAHSIKELIHDHTELGDDDDD